MKLYGACLLVCVFGCSTPQVEGPVSIDKTLVKKSAEEINDAIVNEDFGKVVDLTYPKVVELIGGRTRMITVLESGAKDMKSKGERFGAVKVGDPSAPVKSGSDLFVVVPFQQEMKVPGYKLLQKTFVIGVSNDQGKTWTFVNGDLDVKTVRQVLPNLPDELKLPAREKPVSEKE